MTEFSYLGEQLIGSFDMDCNHLATNIQAIA